MSSSDECDSDPSKGGNIPKFLRHRRRSTNHNLQLHRTFVLGFSGSYVGQGRVGRLESESLNPSPSAPILGNPKDNIHGSFDMTRRIASMIFLASPF